MRLVLAVVAVACALAASGGPGGGQALAAEAYLVQIASMTSAEAARQHFELLRAENPGLLDDLTLTVEAADLGARGTFYRVQVGSFPNQATAEDMCLQLEKQGVDCLVLRR